jgi:hypothetical protein
MIDRREMFALLGVAGAAAIFPTLGNTAPQPQERHHPKVGKLPLVSPGDALSRLKDGNRRLVNGQSRHTEVIIHLPGLNNVDKPPILVFPKLLVCINCGASLFTTPAAEMEQLGNGGESS